MINLSYQFKLRLSKNQEKELDQILDTCRKVYNYALRERKDWLNSRFSPLNACSLKQEYILPADAPFPNYNWRGKFYLKVNKDGTSQTCPECGKKTGKKKLKDRVHVCQFCGQSENRDIAASKVILKRGLSAVGLPVLPKGEDAPGDVLWGAVEQLTLFDISLYSLDKSR